MTRMIVGIIAGLGLAALVASGLEGIVATGVLCGYLFGASVGALGASWTHHVARVKPANVLQAHVVSFAFKFLGVLMGAFALAFVPAAAEIADWKSFIVAYAAATMITLILGSLDISRALKQHASMPVPTEGETA
jgi:hypothetical protein